VTPVDDEGGVVTEVERVVDELAPEPGAQAEDDRGRAEPAVRLALSLAEIARDLSAGTSVPESLGRLVEHAVDVVEGCQQAGVTVSRPGWYRTAAATADIVREVDHYQYAVGEGPCVDALREHEVFRSGDLAADLRWPEFGVRAAELGVRSMLSFRLFSDDDTFGSLNLYSARCDAFPDRSVDIGGAFAAHAGLALSQVRDRDSARNLERALDSNRAISIAIGILMAVHRVDEDAAFDLMKSTSQRLNRKLRSVAADVVQSGQLPD
jgi:GAF domain-containing protein